MKTYTIEGFELLTQQEIFDKAAHHILSTGVRSVEPNTNGKVCSYGGTGCAAAPFIRPFYRNELVGFWPPRKVGFEEPRHEVSLIADIQQCHDHARGSDFLAEFKKNMRRVAAKYSLDTKALN